jgi:IclR family pca regulon transcriptional regulator
MGPSPTYHPNNDIQFEYIGQRLFHIVLRYDKFGQADLIWRRDMKKEPRKGSVATELKDGPLVGQAQRMSPLFNQSLAKAFVLLESFGMDRRAMNLPELAAVTGLGKSAVQRLTFTLESLGYLQKDSHSKKYALTSRSLELGMRYITSSSLIESANPYLLDLNIKCGETVNLSEPDGTDMVFVASFPGHRQISVQLPVGGRYPMYCTAAGRAYLSGMAKPLADRVLHSSDIRGYTPATILDRNEIVALVDRARHIGFAFAEGEFYRGDINIAAPVFGVGGNAVGAVGVSVPVTRWSFGDACAKLGPQISDVAQTISSLFAPKRPVGETNGDGKRRKMPKGYGSDSRRYR